MSRILPLLLSIGATLAFWRYLVPEKSGHVSIPTEEPSRVGRRVVAVADLHGDLDHAYNVLRMAELVDEARVPRWIGGHDILVSTGDIVDRGDDTIALYHMFQRLRDEAHSQGGDVLNCIGNHEMMNALMDWRYVTKGDMDSFDGAEYRRHDMSTKGWIGNDWLTNFSISHTIPLLPPEKIPSDIQKVYNVPQANFVHGGIHPHWSSQGLTTINEVGHSLLFKALDNQKPNGWFPPTTSKEEMQFYGEHGPLWYRGYALEHEAEVCEQANQALQDLQSRHLVMGHTPHLSGFVVRCNGSVLLIDTGISRAYGGEQSALIFETDIHRDGDASWQETSQIVALYRGRMPKIISSSSRHI